MLKWFTPLPPTHVIRVQTSRTTSLHRYRCVCGKTGVWYLSRETAKQQGRTHIVFVFTNIEAGVYDD